MKARIIEALDLPRRMLRDRVDLQGCPHAGAYREGDTDCARCEFAPECRWLHSNDEFVALERKPTAQLLAPLEFAIDYMELIALREGHRPQGCSCPTCRWLREARTLQARAQARP